MRITVQIDVPDGELCNGCGHCSADLDSVFECHLFLTQGSPRQLKDVWDRDKKGFAVYKCASCLEACKESEEAI
jgi:hypothetical protein